jgi:hypothetical protein
LVHKELLICAIVALSYFEWLPTARSADAGLDSVSVVSAPDGGRPVSAKVDRTGTIHLLFDAADGPRYVRITEIGRSMEPSIQIVDGQSKQPGLEFHGADLAVGGDGTVHVAMSTNAWKLKLPKEEWALYYARMAPGASAFSEARNLNRHPSEGFSLAADEKGNVTVCWLSGKLYANMSHDKGATFAEAVEIDPSIDPCDCCTTSTVYGADGRLAVLYREETNNERDMHLILWDQGRGVASRTRISSTLWKIDACPMSAFAVTSRPNGFVAAWPTKDEIYFARIGSDGNTLPPGEIKTTARAGMHTGMLALNAGDDAVLVAWKDHDQLHWQLFDRDGRPKGSPDSARSPGEGIAGVVTSDGRFVLFR